MAEIDVGQEWRRLQELYAGMSEEELAAIADQGYDLTDVAKQALSGEITRRGLKVIIRMAPPDGEEMQPEGDAEFDPATLDLTVGWNVDTREQAAWVKKTLNDAGIPCFFGPDLLEKVDSLEFATGHSIAVRILKNDVPRINWALREFGERFPSEDEPEPEPGDLAVHCPKCNSTEIVFQGFDGQAENGLEETDDPDAEEANEDPEEIEPPHPGSKFNWHCDACGHEWEDDGVES
jgi:hypothetical protein